MEQITEKQQKILNFIRNYIKEQGFPPSVRDICQGVGLRSPSSVHGHLKTLQRAGYLERKDGKTRSLNLTAPSEKPQNICQIPILGHVAAGLPILAEENIEGYVPFDNARSGFEYFALKVKGDSMTNAGIFPADIIIVRKQSNGINGEIVVAVLDDEATVKRYSLQDGTLWLLPENPNYEPIDGTNALILGKVVANIRYYI